jgi:hypothetical protein
MPMLLLFFNQMGGYDIEDALAWKRKIELLIDQVLYVLCQTLLPLNEIRTSWYGWEKEEDQVQ